MHNLLSGKKKLSLKSFHKLPAINTELRGKADFFPIISNNWLIKSPSAVKKNYFAKKTHILFKCKKISKDKDNYSEKIKILKEKIQKVEKIKEKYKYDKSINLNLSKADLIKLKKKAKSIYKNKLKILSVQKIESWWKKCIIKKKLRDYEEFINKNASIIQKAWRNHVLIKKSKQNELERESAAQKIQKVFRGYQIRKKYMIQLKKVRMQKNFEYFSRKKENLLIESALRIKKFWLAYNLVKRVTQKNYEPTVENKRNNLLNLNSEIKIKDQNIKSIKKKNQEKPFLTRLRSKTDGFTSLDVIKEIKGK